MAVSSHHGDLRHWRERFADTVDRNITHYSYFGAFRSDVSNVGVNTAMLTESGVLTDIGSWYMGGVATHNVPKASQGMPNIPILKIFQYLWNIRWTCLVLPLFIMVFLN